MKNAIFGPVELYSLFCSVATLHLPENQKKKYWKRSKRENSSLIVSRFLRYLLSILLSWWMGLDFRRSKEFSYKVTHFWS